LRFSEFYRLAFQDWLVGGAEPHVDTRSAHLGMSRRHMTTRPRPWLGGGLSYDVLELIKG
jgi:hypothetical protein